MKRWVVLGTLATCSLGQIAAADPRPTPACTAWIQSLEPYAKAMDEVLHGAEIEAAYGDLERASAIYLPGGGTEELDGLEAQCDGIRAAVAALVAPVELSALHERIAAYYGTVANSAARIREGGIGAKPFALRAALTKLIDVYDRMLEDFAENGCQTGDMEAIRERMLPEFRQRLQQLEREIENP